MPMKKRPQTTVAESQPISFLRFPCWAPLRASTTKKELKRSTAVPKVTSGISKIGSQVVIWPCSMHCEVSCGSGPTRLLPL